MRNPHHDEAPAVAAWSNFEAVNCYHNQEMSVAI
jgi:hypothetical protein